MATGDNEREQILAENEAVHREVNEAIEQGRWPGEDEAIAFRCECARSGCTAMVKLTRAEYEAVRAHPRRFVLLPGHSEPAIEDVVEAHAGYELVQKARPSRSCRRGHRSPQLISWRRGQGLLRAPLAKFECHLKLCAARGARSNRKAIAALCDHSQPVPQPEARRRRTEAAAVVADEEHDFALNHSSAHVDQPVPTSDVGMNHRVRHGL